MGMTVVAATNGDLDGWERVHDRDLHALRDHHDEIERLAGNADEALLIVR